MSENAISAPLEPLSIRPATPDDAELLARLGAATFLQAFADSNNAEDMAAYLAASFSPALQAEELAAADAEFLIAEIDGGAVAYAKLEDSHAPDCVTGDRPIELVRFYVDSSFHGRKVSHELMKAVLDRASCGGSDQVWLGVWENNARAIAFYRKWSFEIAGKKAFALGSDLQTDFVMVRSLTIGSAAIRLT